MISAGHIDDTLKQEGSYLISNLKHPLVQLEPGWHRSAYTGLMHYNGALNGRAKLRHERDMASWQ